MIKVIKCNTCGEVIGTINKPEITLQDEQEYQQMVTCPSGHSETVLQEEPGE